MQSHQLKLALTNFIEQAAGYLQSQLTEGVEIPFELACTGSGHRRPALYSYRPLTERFIKERASAVRALPTHASALRLLAHEGSLERYLLSRGLDRVPSDATNAAQLTLMTLLEDVFCEQSDFELRAERMELALGALEGSVSVQPDQTTVLAVLEGLAITSTELVLASGLSLLYSDALVDVPEQTLAGPDGRPSLLVLFSSEEREVKDAVRHGREVLRELLNALRLFGDGRVTLGALAWARLGKGSWRPLVLDGGGRPHGMLVIAPEQEDELRAFCNLVSRRTPREGPVAWALDRYHMGCERPSEYQALTDYLSGLRALLEPADTDAGKLPGRLAVLCATPDRRAWLAERITRALALERAVIAGTAVRNSAGEDLARSLGDHLRALLRDVVCGHLDTDLALLADELLIAGERPAGEPPVSSEKAADESPQQADAASDQERLWEDQPDVVTVGL